ncbi:MAG: hypothetical protein ACR2NX_08385 [Chthoniobacterales bacterium]
MANTVPDSYSNRAVFFKNLKTQNHDHAAELHWDAAKLTAIDALLDQLIAAYTAVVSAEAAAAAASANAAQIFQNQNPDLVKLLTELRANPGLSDGMRSDMQLPKGKAGVDPASIKPSLKVKVESGGVIVSGSKNYAELINIYMRIEGTTPWILAGVRRKRLPFEDQTPLKVAGTPEAREYMGRGVIDDEEVGQESDIVRVVFGG